MIKVKGFDYRGGHRLFLTFSDGTSGEADLSSAFTLPALAPLRDEKLFAEAYLDMGTVCWPGDLDLAPEQLYALAHALPPADTLEQVLANEREVSLRELRKLAGVNQTDLSAAMQMHQSEISRFERRDDWLLSTLRRYVEALGGKLEVEAVFGDKRITLRGV